METTGIVTLPGHLSVPETVEKVKTILASKNVALFAVIDHDGEAKKAGLTMRPAKLLIFGNPRAGTPVMVASPLSALDLPLKILVWEDAAGKVQVSYNSLSWLQQRHNIPDELLPNLAAIEGIAAGAAG